MQEHRLSLFYHLGVRDSMGMVDNVVLFLDADAALTDAVKVLHRAPALPLLFHPLLYSYSYSYSYSTYLLYM